MHKQGHEIVNLTTITFHTVKICWSLSCASSSCSVNNEFQWCIKSVTVFRQSPHHADLNPVKIWALIMENVTKKYSSLLKVLMNTYMIHLTPLELESMCHIMQKLIGLNTSILMDEISNDSSSSVWETVTHDAQMCKYESGSGISSSKSEVNNNNNTLICLYRNWWSESFSY